MEEKRYYSTIDINQTTPRLELPSNVAVTKVHSFNPISSKRAPLENYVLSFCLDLFWIQPV